MVLKCVEFLFIGLQIAFTLEWFMPSLKDENMK